MKFEKISENQLKIILTNSDLAMYDIDLLNLDINAEKLNHLFQSMMEQAMSEHNFSAENTPLMIEATALPPDCIMLIITKMPGIRGAAARVLQQQERKQAAQKPKQIENEDGISIFSFDTFDDAAGAADRICSRFAGLSSLYKMNGRFYLSVWNKIPEYVTTQELEDVLSEYGQKHISTQLSQQYLYEHGELMIKNTALRALSIYIRY